jgi:hypothetical protein
MQQVSVEGTREDYRIKVTFLRVFSKRILYFRKKNDFRYVQMFKVRIKMRQEAPMNVPCRN